jgi:hypothetical protein|tara:strand:+ start:936 stop:1256 length:321 start_codon:yes stop_codon:yes gene_type:complete
MEKKSVAQEIREFANRLAEINPEVQEAEEKDATYYRNMDKQNTDHVKAELVELMDHLEQAITYRYKNSHLFFNNGDKAGTGEMYRLKEQLEKLHASWDESVDLYGM